MGRFIPDASTRTAAMENGEVLYAAYNAIPNIDAVRLKDRKDIDVTTDGYSMINPMAYRVQYQGRSVCRSGNPSRNFDCN